jgi:hypothetical protein
MALAPAVTLRTPSAKIAWARIVAVLVPSPTTSPVFSAAWRSICAPRFCSASSRSNSLAMVTPSLQTIGAPHFFWISTDLERGPRVMRTASASCVAPRRIFSRAAERNSTCLCVMACLRNGSRWPDCSPGEPQEYADEAVPYNRRMHDWSFDFLRRQIVGIDSAFDTPFGRRLMVYCDYTASGRCLIFVERYLQTLQRSYANTHTEDDVTGRSMSRLLHEAEAMIKAR